MRSNKRRGQGADPFTCRLCSLDYSPDPVGRRSCHGAPPAPARLTASHDPPLFCSVAAPQDCTTGSVPPTCSTLCWSLLNLVRFRFLSAHSSSLLLSLWNAPGSLDWKWNANVVLMFLRALWRGGMLHWQILFPKMHLGYIQRGKKKRGISLCALPPHPDLKLVESLFGIRYVAIISQCCGLQWMQGLRLDGKTSINSPSDEWLAVSFEYFLLQMFNVFFQGRTPGYRTRRRFRLNTCISSTKPARSPWASRARAVACGAPKSWKERVGTQPGYGLGRSLRITQCVSLGKVEDATFPAGNCW